MLFHSCPNHCEHTNCEYSQDVIPGGSGSSPLASGSFVYLPLRVYRQYDFQCGLQHENDWKALFYMISPDCLVLNTIYILVISKFVSPAPTFP